MPTATSALLERADDMVISDGFNVYSAELENVIAAHPASSRSLSSKSEASVTEKELVELCSLRLGAASRSIAQDAVGKIKRTELREPFWVGQERRVAGN